MFVYRIRTHVLIIQLRVVVTSKDFKDEWITVNSFPENVTLMPDARL